MKIIVGLFLPGSIALRAEIEPAVVQIDVRSFLNIRVVTTGVRGN